MPAPLVASALAAVEIARAVRSHAPDRLEHVAGVIDSLDLVEITGAVRTKAAGYADPLHRILDLDCRQAARDNCRQPGCSARFTPPLRQG